MTDGHWLLDETRPLTGREAQAARHRTFGFDKATEPPVNVALLEATISDTGKWFGSTDVRLDAIVTTPGAPEDQLYQATTFSFPRIKDGGELPIDPGSGLGLYTGWPQYFLDLAIVASRGGEGQKTLAEMLAESAGNLGELLRNVSVLTTMAPQAAAISGAAAAAAKLAAAGLSLLAKATNGKSIGLYRATWYEQRDRFGIGPHPSDGNVFRVQGLDFRYEVFQDIAGGA